MPKDTNGNPIPLAPYKAVASAMNTTLSTAATPVATISAGVTFIRIKPTGQDIVIKFTNWSGNVTDSDYDEYIRDGETYDAYDLEAFVKSGYTTINAKTITGTVTRLSIKQSS